MDGVIVYNKQGAQDMQDNDKLGFGKVVLENGNDHDQETGEKPTYETGVLCKPIEYVTDAGWGADQRRWRTSSTKKEESTSTDLARPKAPIRGCQFKVCVKCNTKKGIADFPKHSGDSEERGSYCRKCKNALAKERRITDAGARLRHYIVTRIKNELPKDKIPKDIHTNLEKYLGYRLFQLKKHLREDLKSREGITLVKSFREGYHMDHRVPHKSFNITEVDSQAFRDCWHYSNLWMIDATTNLKKGAKEDFFDGDDDFPSAA